MRVLLGLVAVALLAAVGTVLLLPGDGAESGDERTPELVAEPYATHGPRVAVLEGDGPGVQRGPADLDGGSGEGVDAASCRVRVELIDARSGEPWREGAMIVATRRRPMESARVILREAGEGWAFETTAVGPWGLHARTWDDLEPDAPELRFDPASLQDLRDPDCLANSTIWIDEGTRDLAVTLYLYPDVQVAIRVLDEQGRGLWGAHVAEPWRGLRDSFRLMARGARTDGQWEAVFLGERRWVERRSERDADAPPAAELLGFLSDFSIAPDRLALFLGDQRLEEVQYTPGQEEVLFVINTAAAADSLGGFRGKVVDAETGDELTQRATWTLSLKGTGKTYSTGKGAEYRGLPQGVGTYQLTFHVDGYAKATRSFEVSSGAVHDLRTIAMRPVEVVEISVQDQQGEPVRIGLKLGYPGPNGEVVFDQSYYSDGDGLIRIEDLAADRYVLRTVTERKLPDGRTVLAPVTWFQVREGQLTKVQIFVEEAVHVPVENPAGVDGRISFHSQGVEVYSTRLSEAEQRIWLLKGQYDWSTSLWDRGRDEGVLGVTPDDPWTKSGTLTVTESARLRLPGPDSR